MKFLIFSSTFGTLPNGGLGFVCFPNFRVLLLLDRLNIYQNL